MGFVDGRLEYGVPNITTLKTTDNKAKPVFKVKVSTDNSPQQWDTTPDAKKIITKNQYVQIGATKVTDLSMDNKIITGPYLQATGDLSTTSVLNDIGVSTGLALLTERIGIRVGLDLSLKGKFKVNIGLAKTSKAVGAES
jgi:hypothetical protein